MTDDAENVQVLPIYTVAKNPAGQLRWWSPYESIPSDHTEARAASPAEIAIIDRIQRHDRAGRMPPASLGARLATLMEATHPGAAP